MTLDQMQTAVLRTLAFHASWSYAPTQIQLFQTLDVGSDPVAQSANQAFLVFNQACLELLQSQKIIFSFGRYTLAGHARQISDGKANEIFFPRKLARARRATAYLKRLPNVRSVCVCNTVALGQSKDASDIDFFIIAKSGSIWRTRLLAALPFKLINSRPNEGRRKDPICLSFFITDQALDLSPLSIDSDDDPYLRYWLIMLLPLSDDGVLHDFWQANEKLRKRHPFAKKWLALDTAPISGALQSAPPRPLPSNSFLEKQSKQIQLNHLPPDIKNTANQDTHVVISDDVLKFHVTDARRQIRERYRQICHGLSVKP